MSVEIMSTREQLDWLQGIPAEDVKNRLIAAAKDCPDSDAVWLVIMWVITYEV